MGRLNAGKGERAAATPGAQGKRPCPTRNGGRPRKVVAAATPPAAREGDRDAVKRTVDFLMILQRLKATKRTGWVRKGVSGPESIADHMYRMSVMAMIAADGDPSIDQTKCIKLAIVHDIAEALAGDIAPSDGVSKAEKHRLETTALAEMLGRLGTDRGVSREMRQLWEEYEAGETSEARLLKDMDKVEMILQAHEYEEDQPTMQLGEFFQSVEGKLKTQTGRQWADEIARRRAEAQQRRRQQQGEEDSKDS